MTTPDPLSDLRTELGGVDRELLALVARRQALASAIGELKHRLGRPTRDYAQEREVLERARRAAESLGLPGDLAMSLLRLLIASSLPRQGQDPPAPAAPPGAAPLSTSARILAGLAERRPAGLVFDVGSLKGPLLDGLAALRDAGVRVTSIHPMFGPDTELLSGRHVIFVDCGVPEAVASARELFTPTMAIQVEMSAAEHDRLIAYVLGLSPAVNIAFFSALASSGEAAPSLERMSSTTFDAQLGVAAQVASENPHLYFEIQSLNQYGLEP